MKYQTEKKAQAGINVLACRVKFGKKARCSGSYFLPISLLRLARIRAFGAMRTATFDCGHEHRLILC